MAPSLPDQNVDKPVFRRGGADCLGEEGIDQQVRLPHIQVEFQATLSNTITVAVQAR